MASPEAIAVKKANAVQAIQKASTALAKKFGIEMPEMPMTARFEPEYARAIELEYLAGVMQSIAVASKAAGVKDFEFDNTVGQKPEPPKVPESVPVVVPPPTTPGVLPNEPISAKDVPKSIKKREKP